MRYGYYGRSYNRDPYGSSVISGYGRNRRYGDNSYREYEYDNYSPEESMEDMHQNYRNYDEHRENTPREMYIEDLNDTLESIVNTISMLKKAARSPEEVDLIRRYIVTINNL